MGVMEETEEILSFSLLLMRPPLWTFVIKKLSKPRRVNVDELRICMEKVQRISQQRFLLELSYLTQKRVKSLLISSLHIRNLSSVVGDDEDLGMLILLHLQDKHQTSQNSVMLVKKNSFVSNSSWQPMLVLLVFQMLENQHSSKLLRMFDRKLLPIHLPLLCQILESWSIRVGRSSQKMFQG